MDDARERVAVLRRADRQTPRCTPGTAWRPPRSSSPCRSKHSVLRSKPMTRRSRPCGETSTKRPPCGDCAPSSREPTRSGASCSRRRSATASFPVSSARPAGPWHTSNKRLEHRWPRLLTTPSSSCRTATIRTGASSPRGIPQLHGLPGAQLAHRRLGGSRPHRRAPRVRPPQFIGVGAARTAGAPRRRPARRRTCSAGSPEDSRRPPAPPPPADAAPGFGERRPRRRGRSRHSPPMRRSAGGPSASMAPSPSCLSSPARRSS